MGHGSKRGNARPGLRRELEVLRRGRPPVPSCQEVTRILHRRRKNPGEPVQLARSVLVKDQQEPTMSMAILLKKNNNNNKTIVKKKKKTTIKKAGSTSASRRLLFIFGQSTDRQSWSEAAENKTVPLCREAMNKPSF